MFLLKSYKLLKERDPIKTIQYFSHWASLWCLTFSYCRNSLFYYPRIDFLDSPLSPQHLTISFWVLLNPPHSLNVCVSHHYISHPLFFTKPFPRMCSQSRPWLRIFISNLDLLLGPLLQSSPGPSFLEIPSACTVPTTFFLCIPISSFCLCKEVHHSPVP